MRRLAILLLAMLPLAVAPAHAELVNGTFDPPAPFTGVRTLAPGNTGIPGWDVAGGSVLWVAGTPNDPAPDGTAFFVQLQDGTLSQSFPTVPGGWYRLDAATESPAGTGVRFLVDGEMVGLLRAGYGSHPVWETRAFRFVASRSWTTLEIALAPRSTGLARLGHLSVAPTLRVTPVAGTTWGWLKQAYR